MTTTTKPDVIYVYADHINEIGKWAYNIGHHIEYGESKGTTRDQMLLMAVLQFLKSQYFLGDTEIIIPYRHKTHQHIYKKLIKEWPAESNIIKDYINDIKWATGNKKVSYTSIPESKVKHHPEFIKIHRKFQGRHGTYFDLDGKSSKKFNVLDPFNNNNELRGYIYIPRRRDTRYGMLYIEYVNNIYCPQWIWPTPKMGYPFETDFNTGIRTYNEYNIDKFEIYEKYDGTNVLAYIYYCENNAYVTYKTRLTPIIKNGKWARFYDLWSEMLIKYPRIPEFCFDNQTNASFEMYGKRLDHHIVQYKTPLEAVLLFCRDDKGNISTPHNSEYPAEKYDINIAELKAVYNNKDMIKEYELMQKRIGEQIEVFQNNEGEDIILGKDNKDGTEGTMWYAIKDQNVIPLKCKPKIIEDIHFEIAAGIPKHSITITCKNIFESEDDPTIDDIIELLKEEFSTSLINDKKEIIEKIFKITYDTIILTRQVIDEYNEHPKFNIIEDKRTVMKHFSEIYDKKDMGKVYQALWREFGQ